MVFTIFSTSLSGIPRINMPVMNNRIASTGAGKAKWPQSVPTSILLTPGLLGLVDNDESLLDTLVAER